MLSFSNLSLLLFNVIEHFPVSFLNVIFPMQEGTYKLVLAYYSCTSNPAEKILTN